MDPKVSICIPTYNQVDKLAILLNSIRSQTYRDFEVIVSDDSTTQDVKDLLDNYADLDIRYIHNYPSKGSPENWNNAISLAKGTWIKLMHHDDYFVYPNSLMEFLDQIENSKSDIDFIFSATLISFEDSSKNGKYHVDLNLINNLGKQPALLFERNLIGSPSVCLYRKKLNLNFDRSLIWLVDVEFYYRIIQTTSISYIDKTLVSTIVSTEQLSEKLRGNPHYEIYELLYCFNKLNKSLDSLNNRIFKQRIIYFLNYFDIKSVEHLLEYTKDLKIPSFILAYLYLKKINRKIAYSIFYRLNKYHTIT